MQDISSRFVSRLSRDTLALILAGGRGSRLKMLTDWRAKPAVPFGGKFRIIDFALSNCFNSDIRRICVLTQYKSHSLIRHVMRGWTSLHGEMGEFVELIPAQQWLEEDSWYAGTADAVHQSMDIINSHHPEYVLILAGDHVYQMDYGEMLAAHAKSGADFTIACITTPREEAKEFGVMTVDEDFHVTDFVEKPEHPGGLPEDPESSLVSMGIYVFSREYLSEQLARDAQDEKSSHDFGKDLIPYAIVNGHHIQAYPFSNQVSNSNAYWRDVGTLDAFFEANMEVLDSKPALDLYSNDWRIWTVQEQLPPAKFIGFNGDEYGIAGNTMVSGGCVISEARISHSLLFSNVRIGKHCKLNSVLALPGCKIGNGCRLTRVLLDNNCIVPPGTIIGEDADADARLFHRTASGITVVTREMLGQAHGYQPSGLQRRRA